MSEIARHYYPVSWEQLHRDAKALAWRLAERGPYERIVAITRGGLVPAHIIARELDVRHVLDEVRQPLAREGLVVDHQHAQVHAAASTAGKLSVTTKRSGASMTSTAASPGNMSSSRWRTLSRPMR